VTRKPGEKFLPECIQPTFRNGRDGFMVWACIAHGVKGPLIRLKIPPATVNAKGRKSGGGLNGTAYADQVVSGPLKDFVASLKKKRGRDILIVEDGAPCH
ncbi:hypothetical protein BDV93DRAFT_420067, partial [Ceratobasidium sp. AG-I]